MKIYIFIYLLVSYTLMYFVCRWIAHKILVDTASAVINAQLHNISRIDFVSCKIRLPPKDAIEIKVGYVFPVSSMETISPRPLKEFNMEDFVEEMKKEISFTYLIAPISMVCWILRGGVEFIKDTSFFGI